MPQVNEFLNSKSMLTPTIAGSLDMVITNGICYSFQEVPIRIVALIFSFLLGLVVFADKDVNNVLSKIVLYIINSFLIFATAMGTANLANDGYDEYETKVEITFMSQAYAESLPDNNTKNTETTNIELQNSLKSIDEYKKQISELQEKLANKDNSQHKQIEENNYRFFKKW
jgi:hypothetical protein